MRARSIRIYLSGKIKKSHELDGGYYWGKGEIDQINESFFPLSIDYLDPSHRTDDLSDEISIFGRDLLQVYLSDVVFADVRELRGIGVGGEMIFAGWIGIPVVSIAEEDSFYRAKKVKILYQEVKDWTHPFVSGPSSYVASSISLAGNWAKAHLMTKEKQIDKLTKIKTLPPLFLKPMQHYISEQLEYDRPMQKLISENRDLKEIVSKIQEAS